MKIELNNRNEKNIVSLSIVTEPGLALDNYNRAIKDAAKQVNIPGFRKGKAPSAMVKQYVGEDYLKGRALDEKLLVGLINEAIKTEKLEVVTITAITSVELKSSEAEIELTAELELYPEVKLGDYKDLNVDVEIETADFDKQVEESLERIVKNNTSFVEAEEGAEIESGDEIQLDFAGKVNIGTVEEPNWEARDAMKAESYQVTVEKGKFIDNFLEQTIGMKVGEEKTIDVAFPTEYHAEDLAGKPAQFDIKIIKISKATAPELNDELAKKNQSPKAETLEELKAKLKENVESAYKKDKELATENAVFAKIRENSEYTVPDDTAMRMMEMDMQRMAAMYGIPYEQFKGIMGNVDQTKELDGVKDRIANTICLNAIVAAESFEHTEEELEAKWKEIIEANPSQIKEADKSKYTSEIEVQLSTEKAKQFVLDAAKINYVEKKKEEVQEVA